jgi:hypothetical protein
MSEIPEPFVPPPGTETIAAAEPVRPAQIAAPKKSKLPLLAAAAQSFYFLVTGLWPLISIATFEAVTGKKTDHWLVIAVGLLVTVIGSALFLSAARRRVEVEAFTLGIGAAIALAGVDIFHVFKGTIGWVYLVDAVAEMLLIALWVFAARAQRRARKNVTAATA